MKVFSILFFLLAGLLVQAQDSCIEGVVTDRYSGDPIPFSQITVLDSGRVVSQTFSDFEGKYRIHPVDSGDYKLKVQYFGYQIFEEQQEVKVLTDQVVMLDFALGVRYICNVAKTAFNWQTDLCFDLTSASTEVIFDGNELRKLASH